MVVWVYCEAGLSNLSRKKRNMLGIYLSYQGTKASKKMAIISRWQVQQSCTRRKNLITYITLYSDPKKWKFKRLAVEVPTTRFPKILGPNNAGKNIEDIFDLLEMDNDERYKSINESLAWLGNVILRIPNRKFITTNYDI